MPAPKRRRIEPTDDWQQLSLLITWPEQLAYELIRPVVLFGFTPAERSQQTGSSARTSAGSPSRRRRTWNWRMTEEGTGGVRVDLAIQPFNDYRQAFWDRELEKERLALPRSLGFKLVTVVFEQPPAT